MYNQIRWLFLLLLFFVGFSCATLEGLKTDVKSTYNKAAGKDVSKEGNEDQEPAVYYVAVEDLKLYPEPRFSENDITVLPHNEKVLRYKLSQGFAYVKVVRTGDMGWLENSSLSWKQIDRVTPPLASETPAGNTPQESISEPAPPKEITIQQDSPESSSLDHLGPDEVQASPPPPPNNPKRQWKKRERQGNPVPLFSTLSNNTIGTTPGMRLFVGARNGIPSLRTKYQDYHESTSPAKKPRSPSCPESSRKNKMFCGI